MSDILNLLKKIEAQAARIKELEVRLRRQAEASTIILNNKQQRIMELEANKILMQRDIDSLCDKLAAFRSKIENAEVVAYYPTDAASQVVV